MSEEFPDAPDVMEELGGQDDAEDRGEMAQEDPVDDLDDVKDRLDSVEERVSFLEEEEDQNQRQIVDIFDPVFPTRLTAFTSGTGGAWIERIASGTVLTDYTGGRFTSAATNISALFGLGETDFVTVEQVTVDGVRAPAVPSGVVDCYLTDLGGGSYDGYLNAAKTIKIFAAQTGQPATAGSTKGLARLVGKTWRFISPLSQTYSTKLMAVYFPADVTLAHSQGIPTTNTMTPIGGLGYSLVATAVTFTNASSISQNYTIESKIHIAGSYNIIGGGFTNTTIQIYANTLFTLTGSGGLSSPAFIEQYLDNSGSGTVTLVGRTLPTLSYYGTLSLAAGSTINIYSGVAISIAGSSPVITAANFLVYGWIIKVQQLQQVSP